MTDALDLRSRQPLPEHLAGLAIYTGALEIVGKYQAQALLIWGEGYSGLDVGIPQSRIGDSAKADLLNQSRSRREVFINHRYEPAWLFGGLSVMTPDLVRIFMNPDTPHGPLAWMLLEQGVPLALDFVYKPVLIHRTPAGAELLEKLEYLGCSLVKPPAFHSREPEAALDPDTIDAAIARAKELAAPAQQEEAER